MNINELQKTQNNNSNDTSRITSTRNYSAKNNSSDFSYYVEVTKSKEVKENIEEKQQELENVEEEILPEEIKDEKINPAIAYIQTVQDLNSEIFDMGLNNLKDENLSNKDIFKYQVKLDDLEMNDIKLFEGLTQKAEININSVDTQNQSFNMIINGENLNISYKSIEVSKTLFTAIENASKTGKPVRLDFGNDTSVILKISKDGKLSADFIPNDKAMETVLKNALPLLKAKFDEENIPYGSLNYKNFNQQKDNQNKNKEKNKDE